MQLSAKQGTILPNKLVICETFLKILIRKNNELYIFIVSQVTVFCVSHSHHHANSSPKPGKSRFLPREGGQKFSDEVINLPAAIIRPQPDGRTVYTVQDLGRNVGYGRDNVTLVRGGRVVVERSTPPPWSVHGAGDVATQFPL